MEGKLEWVEICVHAMKSRWRVEVRLHSFSDLSLASGRARFTPGKRAHDTHWIKGWVGPNRRSGRSLEQ